MLQIFYKNKLKSKWACDNFYALHILNLHITLGVSDTYVP